MNDSADPAPGPLGELAALDDPVEATAGLARLRRGLFGGAPTGAVRLDRYLLVERLSAGGFGTVYRAYDPQLDRHVALKLVEVLDGEQTAQAQERLLDEARVLATVSHPNVIRIYDAGKYEPQHTFAVPGASAALGRSGVFLVLELVDGTTLEAYAREREPSWRRSLALYRQAAVGLSAAHAAGILHLDFKPANAIIGDDGRVRVIDFGLARAAGRGQDGDGVSVAGTPLYSPPEPWAELDARADQFSLCASLFEALHGVAPFRGSDVEALAQAKRAGDHVEPRQRRAIPSWLHEAVMRGLSPDPADRWPSIEALSAALDPRAHRRWPAVLAVGAVIGAGVLATNLGGGSTAAGTCPTVDEVAGQTWDDERRRAVKAALLSTDVPYAASAWRGVDRSMEGYLTQWKADWRTACATGPAALPAPRRERVTACLLSRRRRLASLAELLTESDRALVVRAVDVTDEVEPSTTCLQIDDTQSRHDPAKADGYEAFEAADDRLRVLANADRFEEAMAAGDEAVAVARALGDPAAEARAMLRLASVTALGINPRAALDRVIAVLPLTIEHGVVDTEARAWAELLNHRSRAGERLVAGAALDAVAGAAARRADDPEIDRILLGNRAAAKLVSEDYYNARTLYAELYAKLDHDDRTASTARVNLAIAEAALGNRARALELLDAEADWRYDRYGPQHPSLAYTYSNFGSIFGEVKMWRAARDAFARALELRRETLGPDHHELVPPLCGMAEASLELRDMATAKTHVDECLRIVLAAWGPGHQQLQRPLVLLARLAQRTQHPLEEIRYRWQMVEVAAAAYPVGSQVIASRRADLAQRTSRMFMMTDAGQLLGQILAVPFEIDMGEQTQSQRTRARINIALTFDNMGLGKRAQTALLYALTHADADAVELTTRASSWFRLAMITSTNGDPDTAITYAQRAREGADPALGGRIEQWLARH
ncbi:MAG: serine/threonine protein kinase [Deltaproteobacteria bacterium]|nr:serine/threonine protein kinase [Deltaproteobacteria bacterium]